MIINDKAKMTIQTYNRE